jgi:hypothetical protein
MVQSYDRRDAAALLVEMTRTLEAAPTDPALYQVLHLQASLIALLIGQMASLQIQLELLAANRDI